MIQLILNSNLPVGSRRRTDPLFRFLPLLLAFASPCCRARRHAHLDRRPCFSSANWNLRDNWGGVGVPANGDTVVFPSGAARLVNTNNIAGLRLHEIQFLGLGGGYNVRGQSLSVSNGITVAADAVNTLSVTSVTLHGSQALERRQRRAVDPELRSRVSPTPTSRWPARETSACAAPSAATEA
jgi:hypothetical protein